MLGHEPLDVRDELAAASGSQIAVEQRLPREQAALLESRRFGLGEWLTREVGERRPSPEASASRGRPAASSRSNSHRSTSSFGSAKA